MSELSEKELLLLSNWLYADRSTQYGTIGDMLDSCRNESGVITAEKLKDFKIGGSISAEDCADILREMDGCPDDFKDLCAVRVIDDGGIRGVCYADPNDSSRATVVFRGTGGVYDAWVDNCRGQYLSETDMQKLADDFVRYDCGVYDRLTVTGHSKGGNMAQFVTVTNRDRVESCVSFDGQGFGKASIGVYRAQMGEASYRIKSIAGDKDFVGILLHPIAGMRTFVRTDNDGDTDVGTVEGFHSSYILYKSCEFDEEGNITNLDRQNLIASGLEDSMRRLITGLNMLPGDGNKRFSELIGALVAGGMSADHDEADEQSRITEAAEGVRQYMSSLTALFKGSPGERVPVVTESVYVDAGALTKAVSQIREVSGEVAEVADRVSELRNRLNYKAASRLAVETLLRKEESRLEKKAQQIGKYADALETICHLYSGCEERRVTEIMGTAFV